MIAAKNTHRTSMHDASIGAVVLHCCYCGSNEISWNDCRPTTLPWADPVGACGEDAYTKLGHYRRVPAAAHALSVGMTNDSGLSGVTMPIHPLLWPRRATSRDRAPEDATMQAQLHAITIRRD